MRSGNDTWTEFGLPDKDIPTTPFPIPKFLSTIWQMRHDLQDFCPISTPEGRLNLLIWWSLWGNNEYPAAIEIPNLRSFLNQRSSDTSTYEGLIVSNLMKGIWLNNENLQSTFPNLNSYEVKNYIAWFYIHYVNDEKVSWWIDEETRERFNSSDKNSLKNKLLALTLFGKDLDSLEDNQRNEVELKNATLKFLQDKKLTSDNLDFEPPTANGINLIGHATGELGVGEDVRMMSLALNEIQINHSAFKFPFSCQARSSDMTVAGIVQNTNPHDINIFCIPGFDCFYAASTLGKSFFEDRYNIGFCQWELPNWPKPLDLVFPIMNEMWASTQFVYDCMKASSNIPVYLMPMTVELPHFEEKSRNFFNIPEDKKVFLFTFDFISSIHRKNPKAVIEAFLEAFPDNQENQDICLVIKSTKRDDSNPDVIYVNELCERDKRILWINQTLERKLFLSLLNCCDFFVSLHRSEGFGRNIAEAMLLKKPVIVTNWSGNVDFCNSSNSFLVNYDLIPVERNQYSFPQGQFWANPSIEHAAYLMKECVKLDRIEINNIGERARETIIAKYSKETVSKIYLKHLDKIK